MIKHIAFLTIAALASPMAQAGTSGVLVQDLRRSNGSDALAAAQRSLASRGWTIESTGADALTAKLRNPDVRSRIRVSVSGHELVYEGVTRLTHRGVGNRPTQRPLALYSEAPMPGTWIARLRRDVDAALVSR